jgi:hypothetical protein
VSVFHLPNLSNRAGPRLTRLCAAALLVVASCGGSNSLEGSLSDEVSLDYDAVSVQVAGGGLAIVYTKNRAGGSAPDVILNVTATTSGLDLTKALTIDLTEKVAGQPRGAVTRTVAGDPRSALPNLLRGSITFNAAPNVGASVSGSFTCTFANDSSGQLGHGKTVFGDFQATVKAAGQ